MYIPHKKSYKLKDRGGGSGCAGCVAAHPLFASFIWQKASFVLKKLEVFNSLHTHILVGSTPSVAGIGSAMGLMDGHCEDKQT